jgi:hypothetical protein
MNLMHKSPCSVKKELTLRVKPKKKLGSSRLTFVEIFKEENLAKKPLSRYTLRALKSRHLEVLVTLLMLKIEEEQEKYRKLMRLAEELCIERKINFASDGENGEDQEDVEMVNGNESESVSVFKRQSCGLEGIDSEEILQLKALCHVKDQLSL